MAKRSPPMPFIIGSVTPVTALAAIAASTALPPRARICTAACDASGWLDAATPCCEATTERPGTGKAANRLVARAIIAAFYHLMHGVAPSMAPNRRLVVILSAALLAAACETPLPCDGPSDCRGHA